MSLSTRLLSTTVPLMLMAGQDYALVVYNEEDTLTTVTDPGGTVVASMGSSFSDWLQVNFRAQYSATYYLSVPDTAIAEVDPDCGPSTTTLCHLAVNHTKQDAVLNSSNDIDVYRLKLIAGYSYVLTVSNDRPNRVEGLTMDVMNASGHSLTSLFTTSGAGVLTFKPKSSGTYYARLVNGDDTMGGYYTLGLKSARH
jgi:hypothetical protein